jgi:two-component system LytT family response regulator
MDEPVALRVLIVDDEPLARELLLELLGDLPGVQVIGGCSGGRQALRDIRRLQPDVVFLDIEMPGMSGFQVVKSIQEDAHMPHIVFVTAYADYALEAFEVNAVDYVLKPVAEGRLRRAVERVRGRLGERSKGTLVAAISHASARATGREHDGSADPSIDAPQIDRLPVRCGDVVQLLPFDEIDWVDAAGDYMCVHANGETHILRCTMKQLSDRLSAGPFARIHRSTLVNVNKVREISPLSKGECLLHIGDAELKVSRNYRSAIQHLLP